jgi:hypothetical protein
MLSLRGFQGTSLFETPGGATEVPGLRGKRPSDIRESNQWPFVLYQFTFHTGSVILHAKSDNITWSFTGPARRRLGRASFRSQASQDRRLDQPSPIL